MIGGTQEACFTCLHRFSGTPPESTDILQKLGINLRQYRLSDPFGAGPEPTHSYIAKLRVNLRSNRL